MSKAQRISELVFILLAQHPIARLCEDAGAFWLGELESSLLFRLQHDCKFYDEACEYVQSLNVVPIARGSNGKYKNKYG